MTKKTVLLPLPDEGYDVTEVAVPWRLLSRAGHRVVFATERGPARSALPVADPYLLRDGWFFGPLSARHEPRAFYAEMLASPELRTPLAWGDLSVGDFDALLLPGGHAPGTRQYLGSAALQAQVAAFWALGRPVGAICHGVLVLARARDASTGKSVLCASRTTCLPKYMERTAFLLTAPRLGRHYRTYPEYVEDEVRAALDRPDEQFVRGPRELTRRGTADDDRPAFVVEDGRYVSGRWPGDAYLLTRRLLARLED